MVRAVIAVVVVAVILGISRRRLSWCSRPSRRSSPSSASRSASRSTEPGLHFKIPLIRKVHRFDKRFLEWDGKANQLPTKDKRFIWVDTYARWRITDPLLFFQRLQNERGAQSRLDDILDGETRNAIANHDLVELVRTSNRTPEHDESLSEGSSDDAGADRGRPRGDPAGDPGRRPDPHPGSGDRDPRRPVQAHQLRRRGAGEGLRPDDRRAPPDRRPLPLRGRGRVGADPRRDGARSAADRVRGLQDGRGDQGPGRRRGHRRSTPRPTIARPTAAGSTSS